MLTHWQPESATPRQLLLESRAESAFFTARFGVYLLALSTILLVFGIANILAQVVPGAMCGTGVLQAMGSHGARALCFRSAAVCILFAWRLMDKLDRHTPRSHLALAEARTFLLAVPFVVMGVADTFSAALSMNVIQPVNCCAVVYDRFQVESVLAGGNAGQVNAVLVVAALVLGAALLAASAAGTRAPMAGRPNAMGAVALLSLVWLPVAGATLVRVVSAYHYQVLDHHCPWCFFLPEHGCVGILLYGLLGVILFEGAAAWLAAGISRRHPRLKAFAVARAVSACRRLSLALAAFGLAAGLPAVLWRLRHGVWMG
jgi:hypothetical protein